ncbi:MAG: hypothetical protein KF724_12760 [Phycisphaeraceae bacterium]|nr:hypothetical protein [Phycisphaeraceae bacterium]
MDHDLNNESAFLNGSPSQLSMNLLQASALDETVVNARRRFRRVLAAWAGDLLVLSAKEGRTPRWRDASTARAA